MESNNITHHLSVFLWDGEAIKINSVSETFKIPTNQEEINMDSIPKFTVLNRLVDSIELPMTTSFNSNIQFVRHRFSWVDELKCVNGRPQEARKDSTTVDILDHLLQ
jgi:hypothetical protein